MNQAYESASFVRCVVPETADIQAASAAVAANPESGDAWMKKGHALAKVSMMREAEECYAMAISCDPFNWEYYRHRAHRFLSCWRFEDAAADFVADNLARRDMLDAVVCFEPLCLRAFAAARRTE